MCLFMKSGNLNFLEPSEPLQACNGIALHINNIYSVVGNLHRAMVYMKTEVYRFDSRQREKKYLLLQCVQESPGTQPVS